MQSASEAALHYVGLGFVHILPLGLDHVLFVLGLYFAGGRAKQLLLQLTSFTLAHSITLALASLGFLRLPAALVEPLIALSIAYVALENLVLGKPGSQRFAVVFVFGLLHGLGFASALGELAAPPGRFLLALLTFNLGVELGQASVLALALLACGWWRHEAWFPTFLAKPASALIALFGAYWMVERVVA